MLDDLTFGQGSVRIPHLEVEGANVSKEEAYALLDPQSAEPAAARLNRFSATRIRIPQLSIERTVDGHAQTTIYRDIALDAIAAGKIDHAIVAGGAFADDQSASGTFGRIEAFGLDPVLSLTLSTATNGGTSGRVFASLAFADLKMDDGAGGAVALDGLKIGAVDVHAPAGGFVDTYAAATAKPAEGADAVRANRLRGEAALKLIGSLEIGPVEMTGLQVAARDGGKSRIDRIAYGPDKDGHDGLTLKGLSAGTEKGRLTIGEAAMEGLEIRRSLATFVQVASGAPPEAILNPRPSIVPVNGRLHIAQVAFATGPARDEPAAPARPEWGTEFSKPHEPEVAIESIDMQASAPGAGALEGAVRVTALAVPLRADGPLAPIADLGYDMFRGGLALSESYAADSRELTIKELSVTAPGMGSVVVRSALGDLDPSALCGDRAATVAALAMVRFRSLAIDVQDGGLVGRLMAHEARRQRRPEADLRREYAAQAALGLPLMLGGSGAAATVGTAVAGFITKPGRLAIRITPRDGDGLPLADMIGGGDASEILFRLNVEATAE